MSLLQFPRQYALFVDDSGHYVGKKRIGWSFGELGLKKKTFDYGDGTYNIKPDKASRLHFIISSRLIFDDYFFVYNINNPDPIRFKNNGFIPIMDPRTYKKRLTSNLVKDLQEVAKGKLEIPWKWVIAIGIGVLVVWYIASGGDISSLTGGGGGA